MAAVDEWSFLRRRLLLPFHLMVRRTAEHAPGRSIPALGEQRELRRRRTPICFLPPIHLDAGRLDGTGFAVEGCRTRPHVSFACIYTDGPSGAGHTGSH